MELHKLIELLKRIPDQNAMVGQIFISNGGVPMVVLLNGKTYVVTDRGVIIHDPKYKPQN